MTKHKLLRNTLSTIILMANEDKTEEVPTPSWTDLRFKTWEKMDTLKHIEGSFKWHPRR